MSRVGGGARVAFFSKVSRCSNSRITEPGAIEQMMGRLVVAMVDRERSQFVDDAHQVIERREPVLLPRATTSVIAFPEGRPAPGLRPPCPRWMRKLVGTSRFIEVTLVFDFVV